MRTTSTGELVLTYCLYFATDEEVVDDDNDDEDGVAHVEQKLGITHCLLDLLTRSE